MNKSKLILIGIISTSIVFLSSAMEHENDSNNNQQTVISQLNRQAIINLIPVIGRLSRGEPGHQIILDGFKSIVSVLETGRQGYLKGQQLYQDIQNSPTTQTITAQAQAGAKILVDNVYSMGAYATQYVTATNKQEQSEEKQLTFQGAHAAFKKDMALFGEPSQREELKKSISESLVIIRTDIPAVGIRTAIIDHIIEEVNSENNITAEIIEDCTNIIDEIARISKTKEGENSLETSTLNPFANLNDEEMLLSQLLSLTKTTEDSIIKNNILLDFVTKYMHNNSNIQTVLEHKQNEIAGVILRLLIPAIKQEMDSSTQLLQEKDNTIKTLDETAKQNATSMSTQQQKVDQAEKNATFWKRCSISGITIVGLLAILYKLNMLEKIVDQVRSIAYFNK